MKKIIHVLSAIALLSACGGRTANPVQEKQFGDAQKSCESLEIEMSSIEADIQRLIPETEKTGKNVALGTAGVFLIVPFFFMDLSDSEKIEVEAARKRYNFLAGIAVDKKCAPISKPKAESLPDNTSKTNKPSK